ncbi:nuclear RNA export factor 3-like [Halichoerus grypus]|uniref:nuclear RNA export factor 3-like n=1 Tax=Halichoerus grypus TaxID=9711 RepID=UPI001659BB32|nr:nuclear RNA export factor 3-like [Halichoerus grypus]
MKKLKDASLRVQPLKHTKCDIMRSLCVLPKTQHDLSSFMVDMWFQTETMLCFSVNGVFKEVGGMSQFCVHLNLRCYAWEQFQELKTHRQQECAWTVRQPCEEGGSKRAAICKPAREASEETKPTNTLILDF